MSRNFDKKLFEQLENVLNTKIYPGTEVMKDVGNIHFIKDATKSDHVLVPQPSNNEHDPLNWSPMWKGFTIFCATMVTFSQGLGPLALAPMFPDYIKAFNSDLAGVIQFTGVTILVLGFSNFIWVPMQTCYGRRPTILLSSAICFGSTIWRARATSYSSFIGACVLHGIGAGPAETIQPTIIADVIFLHHRGRYQTLYFAFYFGSLTVGPIIAGPMSQHLGWQSFWWFNTGLIGLTILCCIFLFPETRYSRTLIPDSSSDSASLSPASKSETIGSELSPTVHDDTEEVIRSITVAKQEKPDVHEIDPIRDAQDSWLGRGKPSRQQFHLFQPYEGNILLEFFLPFQLFALPIVEFSAFVVSWTASVFLMVNLTQTQAFAAPPYEFNSEKIGLFNLATWIGTLIGLFTAGPLSDTIAAQLTKRNNGIREPEMRLLAMVPYVVLMIIGNVVVAVGYQQAWDWKIIVIIGYTCIGIQVAALPAISSTYAIDSYKPVTGAIFVMVTINKNVWGYGLSRFITPWIVSDSFIPPILVNMALTTIFCGSAIIFWFFGKRFRGWSKNSKLHTM